jgi:multicomponent Na+:H+ antiporter subunit C
MKFEFAFLVFSMIFSFGLFGALFWGNLFKKMLCISVFSNSIIIFYLIFGYYLDSKAPILHNVINSVEGITNPLPSVLMLTAIVVGVSIQALGFALIIRVKKEQGTLEEDELLAKIELD